VRVAGRELGEGEGPGGEGGVVERGGRPGGPAVEGVGDAGAVVGGGDDGAGGGLEERPVPLVVDDGPRLPPVGGAADVAAGEEGVGAEGEDVDGGDLVHLLPRGGPRGEPVHPGVDG